MLQLEKEKKAKFTSSLTDSFVKILYNEKINAKEIAEQLNKNPLFTEIKEPINYKLINFIKSNSPEKIQNKALEVLTEEVKIDNKENLGKTTRESKNNNIEIKELLAEKLDLNQDPQIYEILSNDTNSRVVITLMQNPTSSPYNFKDEVFNKLKNNKYWEGSNDIAWNLILYAEKPEESSFRLQEEDLSYLYKLESSDPIYQRRSYIAKNFDDRFAKGYGYAINNLANDSNIYVLSNLIHNIHTPVDVLFKVYENLNKGLYKEGSTVLAEELKDILKTRSPDRVKLHLKINTNVLMDFNTDEDKINYYSDLILRDMLSTNNFLKYIKKEHKGIKDKTIMQAADWLSENYYSSASYDAKNRAKEVIEWGCKGIGKKALKEYIATKPNLPDRIYEVLINSIFSKKDIKTKALQNVSAYYISKNHEKIKNLIYKNSDFASAILSNSHAPEDIVQLIKDNPKYNKNTN